MSNIRLSGLVSGLDTDKMISDLMKIEKAKVDKVTQQRKEVEWKQSAYREIISKVHDFQKKYFDVLKPESNFKSSNPFAKFDYKVTEGGKESSAVTVQATAKAGNTSFKIDRVDQLATADTIQGKKLDLRSVKTGTIDIQNLKTADKGLQFNLAVGSSTKKISVSSAELNGLGSVQDLGNLLNDKIKSGFGSDYSNIVKVNGDKLSFSFPGNSIIVYQSASDGSSAESASNLGLDAISLVETINSESYKQQTISELFDLKDSDLENISVNGKKIEISGKDTLEEFMKKMNDSKAGMKVEYSTVSDSFRVTSQKEGSANNLSFDNQNTKQLFEKLLGSSIESADRTFGQNAKVIIEGQEVIQSSNTFQYAGSNITLHHTSNKPIDIEVKSNTEDLVKSIKHFIEEYNGIVDILNKKTSEKRNYDFRPLSDEMKKEMTEKEVEEWEKKAKQGLLKGDIQLSNMVTKLRNAIIEPIKDLGISLSDIGISSKSYADKGKLSVDETKLKQALENKYDDVVRLFTKQSSQAYGEDGTAQTRRAENGISFRIEDILKDFTRTTRDKEGKKGFLIEKAGIQNDLSDKTSLIAKELSNYDKRISQLQKDLLKKEQLFYRRFAAMESAMSKLQSQTNQLLSGLGR